MILRLFNGMKTLSAKIAISFLFVGFFSLLNFGFLKSNGLDFFHQGLNQHFCFRESCFNFCVWLKLPDLLYRLDASLY